MTTVHLWAFPDCDFSAWCELCGSPQVGSFVEYMTLLAAVQADLERTGLEVFRVKMTVAEMRGASGAWLAKHSRPSRGSPGFTRWK